MEGGEVTIIAHDEELPFDRHITTRRAELEETELMFGSELRFDASYFLWRDVAINFGFETVIIGRGVARGFDVDNDESLVMFGGTLGVVVNR